MEIEAKFAITGALEPAQIAALDLAPYSLRAAGVERHRDMLLDTPTRAITGTGHALRIRAIAATHTTGARRILTLKGPSQSARGSAEDLAKGLAEGVHEREELEAPLHAPSAGASGYDLYDPRGWPPEIGAPVLELTQGEPLSPLLRVQVERRLWTVRRNRQIVAELALDSGEIIAAWRHEPLHEVEVELKGSGARSDLDLLSARLRQALPLTPEPRSKSRRGLALLRHARWVFDGYTPLEATVRHALRHYLRAWLQAQRGVLEQGDADAIHDMRVATRRMRSALQACEGAGAFKDETLHALRHRLSAVADELGEARDLDIFLKRVADWVGTDEARTRDLEPLRDLLAARRLAGYERLVARLRKRKHARLALDLSHFVSAPTPGGQADGQDEGPGCTLTRHFAGSALWPRYEAILRYETVIAEAEPPTLHQLRIACKRLRYVLELFATPLGGSVAPLRKALMAAQSYLGDTQDLTVALRLVGEMLENAPDNAGLRAFARALAQERDDHVARVGSVWEPLRAQQIRAALAQALAAL